MSDLDRAELTWDTIDIDAVRSVAWSAVDQVSADVWKQFSGGVGPTQLISQLLAKRGPKAGLRGAAVVCGDMVGERIFFEHLPDVAFDHVDGFDISRVSMDRYVPDVRQFTPPQGSCNR